MTHPTHAPDARQKKPVTGLSELFQFIRSGIRKIDVSVNKKCQPSLIRSKNLGVSISEPCSVTVLGNLVKEREKRVGKLERSAYVGRLVDN
jgi:hypothetical protein